MTPTSNHVSVSKKSTVTLTKRESSSCLVRIQKSWGIFIRKLFHMTAKEDERGSTITGSKSKATRSSKSKSISAKKTTDTCFKVSEYRSSISLAEVKASDLDLHLDLRKGEGHKDRRRLSFVDLPQPVRETIYNFLTPQDILSLRLTCRALKTDVTACHGVILRMHDGRLDYETPLQTMGIVKLIVEQFIQEDSSVYMTYFPFPLILKELTIAGPISQTNFQFLLKLAENLEHLTVHFEFPTQHVDTFNMERMVLDNLKILEISSDSFLTPGENFVMIESIRDLFGSVHCPCLSYFVFNIVGLLHEHTGEHHELVMGFILKYWNSLKRVKIQIIQVMGPAMPPANVPRNETPRWLAEWLGRADSQLNLEEFHLNINWEMQRWYPVINAQSCLHTLKLDVKGQVWNRLTTVFNRCGGTLQNLSITGLMPARLNNPVVPEPLDIGYLERMRSLETLEIQHEEVESRGLIPASLIRTSVFPQTLRSVKLVNLRLKPYQAMFLFLKLPRIEHVVLNFWADSEGTLTGFITVLNFLIKFNQTPARMIEMADHRRKMENQQDCIWRMKNILVKCADVRLSYSELYGMLTVERFIEKL